MMNSSFSRNNYEQFRYQDKFMKLDNLKFHIANDEDIEEIKDVIDYAEGLVIKDHDLAESYETLESTRNANIYINVALGITTYLTEFEKQTVLSGYKELNKYYIDLKENFNIEYIDARLAKDFQILKANNNSLSEDDKNLFHLCYNDTIKYFLNVLKTDAFSGEKLNKNYFREILVFFTIQKYITRKMERYFDVDKYTKYECKNTFISYGIDYFDKLPIAYKRKLIKNLNRIIQYKGTDRCLEIILDAFGMQNVKLYKYVLAKDWKKNDLFFYKTPLNEVVNTETDTTLRYEDVVEGDALWQADKEEILESSFNTINTKYITVDLATNMLESTMNMSYLISLIYLVENSYASGKTKEEFTFTNKKISKKPIDFFDAIIAVLILTLKRQGYSTVINHNAVMKEAKSIYGFNNLDSNDEIIEGNYTCRDLIHDIKLELIRDKYHLRKTRKFDILYDFFGGFTMENFKSTNLYSENDIKKIYNGDPIYYDELVRLTHFYHLSNIQHKIEDNDDLSYLLTDILYFISERLISKRIDIEHFKKYFPNFYTLIAKFNIFMYRDTGSETKLLERCLNNDKVAMEQLDLLVNKQNNIEINIAWGDRNIEKVIGMLKVMIEKRRQELLNSGKPIEDVRKELEKDPADLSHYKRLEAYFETFTMFNTSREKFYGMSDFIKILDYNEKLKKDLESFINESNNYKLYMMYNKLWESKFSTKQNLDLFKGYETWEDWLMSRDGNLIDFIKMPESIKEDKKKMKEWYDENIFELCESLDLFIGDPNRNHFVENSFIGIAEFIRRYIMITIIIFKAYTIDLLPSTHILQYFDPTFNTLRFFDEIVSIDEEDVMIDRFHLEDFFGITSTDVLNDKFKLKDAFSITVVNYEVERDENGNPISDIPIKDAKGNYIVRNTNVIKNGNWNL